MYALIVLLAITDIESTKMAITPLVLGASSSSSEQGYDIPSLVTVHPVAVASILDHYLRRPRDAEGKEQDRVIGTLMGTTSEVRRHQHRSYDICSVSCPNVKLAFQRRNGTRKTIQQ